MARLALFCTFFLSAGAYAQVPQVIEVIPSDEPVASLDLGESLILGLGRPWAEVRADLVAPDSGTVDGGAGRVRWRVPDFAVDAFDAEIRGGLVDRVTLDFSADGPDFSDYAGRLRQQHGAPGADGFYAPSVLGHPFSLAVRVDDRRLEFRAAPGQTVPAGTPLPIQFRTVAAEEPAPAPRDTSRVYDVAEEAPEIVGGLGALYRQVVYPADALSDGVGGTVVVLFVVSLDGTATDVVAVRSPDERLSAAAVAAVRGARFWPGHEAGLPVRTRMSVAVRFDPETDGSAEAN